MRTRLLIVLILVVTAISCFAIGTYAASDISIVINGKKLNASVELINGTSFIPVRSLSESLGADVKWDDLTRTIFINTPYRNYNSTEIATEEKEKSYNLDIHEESGPMRLNISKVTFTPAYKTNNHDQPVKAVVLQVRVENTSNDAITWNLKSGQLVLDTREYVPTGSAYLSDNVDGIFYGKGVKEGNIVFQVNSKLYSINKLTYIVDGPFGFKTDYPESFGPDKAILIQIRR
jgi:hypothetical protein